MTAQRPSGPEVRGAGTPGTGAAGVDGLERRPPGPATSGEEGGAARPGPRQVSAAPGPDHPAWARLTDQLDWYDRKSQSAQQSYKRFKVLELVMAAAIPVVAGFAPLAVPTAVLGAGIVVLEGVQHLYQWQTNWVLYRSTAEALKHEKFLFLSAAGPYATGDVHRVLAERLEGLISQEHAKWTQGAEQADHGQRVPG